MIEIGYVPDQIADQIESLVLHNINFPWYLAPETTGYDLDSPDALPTDVNWRLKMITAGTAWTTLQPDTFPLTRGDILSDAEQMLNALPGDQGEEGFDALRNYVSINEYASTWLRPGPAMLVVFVSDEEEQSDNSVTVGDFTRWYESYRSTVFLASIVNVPRDESICDPPPVSFNVGDRYIEAAEYFEGEVVDICLDDWSLAVRQATNCDLLSWGR